MGQRRVSVQPSRTAVWGIVIVLIAAMMLIGNDRATTDNEVRLECVKHQPLSECRKVK